MNCVAEMPGPAALALVPGLEAGTPPLRLERLAGGTVNDCWRVDTLRGRFVLRVDGPAWRRPGVDRDREQRLHDAAAGAGLAPRVLLRAAAVGAQVSEYLEGSVWHAADLSRPESLARLGERLAQTHALEVPAGAARFDPDACARQYLGLMDLGVAAATGAAAVVAALRAAAERVADGSRGAGIIHGDLMHSNLLDGDALWFLDWEYAQRADPLYDAACVLAYYPAARPHARRLLAAAGLAGAGVDARLGAAIEVYQGLTWLWHRARGVAVGATG